jgi:hypothetical protein
MAFPSTYTLPLLNNGMISVPWAEFITKQGSSAESAFGYADGNQSTLSILVGFNDLAQAVSDLLGYQQFNPQTTNLDRNLPAVHPFFNWLWCSRISGVHPYRFQTKVTGSGSPYPGEPSLGSYGLYDLWVLTCVFTQPKFAMYSDNFVDSNYTVQTPPASPRQEFRRFLEVIPQPASFALTRDANASFTFVEGGGGTQPTANTTNVPTPSAQFLTQVDYNFLWRRVPQIGLISQTTGRPDNLIDSLNKVNDAAFLGFPKGTLLFKSFRLHPVEDPVSPTSFGLNLGRGDISLVYDVELVFSYFNPPSGITNATNFGWNLAPWTDNRWYLVKDIGSKMHTIYDYTSFPVIFTLQS